MGARLAAVTAPAQPIPVVVVCDEKLDSAGRHVLAAHDEATVFGAVVELINRRQPLELLPVEEITRARGCLLIRNYGNGGERVQWGPIHQLVNQFQLRLCHNIALIVLNQDARSDAVLQDIEDKFEEGGGKPAFASSMCVRFAKLRPEPLEWNMRATDKGLRELVTAIREWRRPSVTP